MVRGSRFKEHFDCDDVHISPTTTTTATTSISQQQQQSMTTTNNTRSPLRRKNSNRTGVCTLKRNPHVKKRQFSRSPSVVHPMSRSPSFQQKVMSNSTTATNAATVVYRASNTPITATNNNNASVFGKNVSTTSATSPHRPGRTKFLDWCLKQKAKLLHRPHHR
ncbi:hypothetical protein BDA99DRAFT_541585 [Phascolomyces articulosus]|uniref:Uncharacterized protein n=1 Tax=Phascolomyces articulosus TaxID=60185 RepID=A0AAD5P9S6_9FUNG|nr:hypothetical protein BDA99DRAFT_541585 [Phascolomyces articulosus]